MTTLSKVYEIENLERAWRWIRSNPDPTYKSYFRSAYSRYALADAVLLADLRGRLQRGIYEPEKSSKLYLPKRSGILRPYSLLNVEDQIVYQAFINIIAEQLFPRVRSRYLVEVFGHLYAGKSSIWFYRRWSDGYSKFNDAAKDAFKRGLIFSASFDLTAYYDSLDHRVLEHFLRKIGCSVELYRKLTEFLTVWTATDHQIFHGHGIPQGPLGSGLLSEVVLQHFDQNYAPHAALRYLRYVDDIRLFATSEADLRKMLVRLDMLSKDVGLFPQGSKIEIHEVKDINEELKSVSCPPEAAIKTTHVDQSRLRKRLAELSPRFDIVNETRFKYLLAHAKPHSTLNTRLIRIYAKRPDLTQYIGRYLRGYLKLPNRVGEWLIGEIGKDQLYRAVHSELITVAVGRLKDKQERKADRLIKRLWNPSLGPDILSAIGRWTLSRGLLTPNQVDYALRLKKTHWWSKCNLIECLSLDYYGEAKITEILNAALRDRSTDIALTAAVKLAELECNVYRPMKGINRRAGLLLRELGIIARAPDERCGIDLTMTELLGKDVARINWKEIFDTDHRKAELQAIWCRAYARTDATAFVNAMDVFNDWLLIRLYNHDTTLGSYTAGKIGSVLNSTRLKNTYPAIFAMIQDVHNHRYESHLSHAKIHKTGKPTGYIRFGYLKRAKRLMRAAFIELKQKW